MCVVTAIAAGHSGAGGQQRRRQRGRWGAQCTAVLVQVHSGRVWVPFAAATMSVYGALVCVCGNCNRHSHAVYGHSGAGGQQRRQQRGRWGAQRAAVLVQVHSGRVRAPFAAVIMSVFGGVLVCVCVQ